MSILNAVLFLFIVSPAAHPRAATMPSPLLRLDDRFSHHVVVVEKSTHRLHLYTNEGGAPKLVRSIQIATGKKAGNKLAEGDHRTPEGIYQITGFLSHKDLMEEYGKDGEIYGVGAFVLNYPNVIDASRGKTGGGIWIHSTNDESRIEKGLESRGCVVTANGDLIRLARHVELHRTPVIVVHNLNFISGEAWRLERDRVAGALEDWLDAWRNEDLGRYLAHYHPRDFRDPVRGWGAARFGRYKRDVFAGPGRPSIAIDDVSILRTGQYAVVSFRQDYRSRTVNDVGRKSLYMRRDDHYDWKIVSEVWTKAGLGDGGAPTTPFRPSQRFFATEDPSGILTITASRRDGRDGR